VLLSVVSRDEHSFRLGIVSVSTNVHLETEKSKTIVNKSSVESDFAWLAEQFACYRLLALSTLALEP
jgi:hypothetical protein